MVVRQIFRVGLTSRARLRFRGGQRVRVRVLIVLLLDVVVQIRPGEPSNILSLVAVEACHSPQSVCANDDAPENISSMSVTLDTSHLEMSLLKNVAK